VVRSDGGDRGSLAVAVARSHRPVVKINVSTRQSKQFAAAQPAEGGEEHQQSIASVDELETLGEQVEKAKREKA